jgi:hypothetical protein
MLTEVGGWTRQILAQTSYLTSAQARRPVLSEDHRKLMTACRWLATLVAAMEQAEQDEPMSNGDLRQLHAIPLNELQPRRRPKPAETVAELRQGTAECAERVRQAAATAVREAAWSPCLTAESFSQTAESATAIAHHCEILLRTLATEAAQQQDIQLSEKLIASAESAAGARLGWLEAARAWYGIRTDAVGDPSPVSAEAADLALWTGRLAYADSDWSPQLKPADVSRPPAPGIANARDFSHLASAAYHASFTLTAIAASDYAQMRTAARKGRLIVPALLAGKPGRLFDRAPAYRSDALLHVYRQAGAASVRAIAKISRIAEQVSPEQHIFGPPGVRVFAADRPTSPGHRRGQPLSPSAMTTMRAEGEMPGPVERALRQLGVTDQPLLARAVTLDQATSDLLNEATEHTAAQRWNIAASTATEMAGIGNLINLVLARESSLALAIRSPELGAAASSVPDPEAEAEP